MNEKTYWNSKGKYQELSDKFEKHTPMMGKADGPIEIYRCMVRIYHDWFNNGFCNYFNLTDFFETLQEKGSNSVATLAENIQNSFPFAGDMIEIDCDCGGEDECWECDYGVKEVKVENNWGYAEEYLTKSKYDQVERWLEILADVVIIQVDHELKIGHWV